MTCLRFTRIVAGLFVLCAAPVLSTQAAGQPPPMPKPGPEHGVLKMDVGYLGRRGRDQPGARGARDEIEGGRGEHHGLQRPVPHHRLQGRHAGSPFLGHGVTTWDPAKKKYVGSWTDSMSTGLAIGESTYDAAAKKATGSMEGPDHTGKLVKARSVVEWKNATTRVMTMFAPGPDGKEMETMKITYTRRK